MSFEAARAVADAVLLEGYVLYPYRSTAPKNQLRWAFGVLAPAAWTEAGGSDPSWMEAQCLVEADAGAEVSGKLRFMRSCRRSVEVEGREVDALEVDGRLLVPWDEGEVREVDFTCRVGERETEVDFGLPGRIEYEPVYDADKVAAGRVVRSRAPITGTLRAGGERLGPAEGGRSLWRVRVRADNRTPWAGVTPRDEALQASCLATHVLLATEGAFVSLLDPPGWAEQAAAGCVQTRCWPVLVGPPGSRDLLLAAPIILYDHPQLAPESLGDFFDATEIDELLTLRTLTLTNEEKRQARATDPRAAALLDRVEALEPDAMRRLHGALRDVEGGEMRARWRVGDRVRLRPGARRTDAQDLLYAGQAATVEVIRHDVDGRVFLGVTVDADPAAELNRLRGLFHYYTPDEVEPLGAGERP